MTLIAEQRKNVLDRLSIVWNKHPDYPLGQLLSQVFPIGGGLDMNRLTSEEFIIVIEKFYDKDHSPIA